MFDKTTITDFLRRFLAAGAAALVLALTVLAASPEAHEHVHHDCHHDADHSCAVVLFAQGIWTAFEAIVAPAPNPAWQEFIPPPRTEPRLVTPRYLRQPGRGPPVS